MPATHDMKRLLIANRGEIACRIIRTASEMGIETVAVYSEPDRGALHASLADRAVALGGDTPATSYLDIARVVDAAIAEGADAVHPGYGFLAENATFARAVTDAGLVFVGPRAETIESMGDKISARRIAVDCGLPVIPTADLGADDAARVAAATGLGFPVVVKAAAGGGGRGMRVVTERDGLAAALDGARREAGAAFGDDRVYLEKYLTDPRHIEVQVFGDGSGRVLHLGERECSVQRRHQKIIEEAPSPAIDDELREEMGSAAVALAESMGYLGAGTVEFVVDDEGRFYFLEMNTRLQVEHAVTEMVTSTDLVRWQLEVASGASLPASAPPRRGHAIECRVYAEDPAAGFVPTAGVVRRVEHPSGPGIRVDSALFDGFRVPVEYDPMLAKVVAWAPDRDHAIARMRRALEELALLGVVTNIAFLVDVLGDPAFTAGEFRTTTVEQRYADWRRASDRDGASDDLAVAAAAAALLVTAGGAGATSRTATREQAPDPWETLGAWRVGGTKE